MKKLFIPAFLISIICLSCAKDEIKPHYTLMELKPDYRDSIAGEYEGIYARGLWMGTTEGYVYDTTAITISVAKVYQDSIIELTIPGQFNPFSFKYDGVEFFSSQPGSILMLSGVLDSLYVFNEVQPESNWIKMAVKKM